MGSWGVLLMVGVALGMNTSTSRTTRVEKDDFLARISNTSRVKSDVFHGSASNTSGVLYEPNAGFIPWRVFQDLQVIAQFNNEMIRMIDFPWLVSLQNEDGSHLCSANILTSLYVLTTCGCLTVRTGSVVNPVISKRPEDIYVVAGVSRLDLPLRELMSVGQVRDVEQIHPHPRCSPRLKYDFAVAELDHFLYFSPFVRPVLLPYEKMEDLSHLCTTAGWRQSLPGWERPENYKEGLVVTDLKLLTDQECPDLHVPQEGAQFMCTSINPIWHYSWDGVWSDETPESRNPGDHGSGLLCNGKVIAILSHHTKSLLYPIFTNVGPAMSFLSPFYQDFEDNTISNAPSLYRQISLGSSIAYQTLIFHALQ